MARPRLALVSTFGQEIVAALAELREHAVSTFIDTVTIARQTGSTPDGLGGETPTMTPVYPDPAWAPDHPLAHGPAKVQGGGLQSRTPEAGGHSFTVQPLQVHIPVCSYAPEVGDVITVATAALDPNLAGTELRVTALAHKSMATAYRLAVENTAA